MDERTPQTGAARPTTAPRGRLPKRVYLVRRLMALGLVVLLVAVLVLVVSALGGGDEPTDTTQGSSPVGTAATDGTAPVTTDPASTTSAAPAPTEPPATGPPTADEPAKVLILGDSDAGTFGPYLMSLLDQNGVTDSELFYKVSSGLSRPDFFDWPAEISRQLPAVDPDILVVTFGGNDAQDLLIDGAYKRVDTPEWREEYGRRVGEVMDMMTADGRTLIWVGIPNAESADFTTRLEVLRDVTLAEIEERPESVVYIDTWNRFAGLSGGYADYVIDPRDGQGKNVRADDGFHLNITGAEILALDIAKAVEDALRALGADI